MGGDNNVSEGDKDGPYEGREGLRVSVASSGLREKLHEMESRSPFKDPMSFEDISKLKAKVVILSEELEQKADEMEVMESFCDSIPKLQKKVSLMSKQFDEKAYEMKAMESLNQTLRIKEQTYSSALS
ncbi:hypothetical protein GIB67_029903 [Kingdonia uniflora]|uniref:Uncharacterized protein n=1 Tax=Kingdonia uniflora TaxID=39325 RepID=A0A7J7P517_9MAGN|nr:hypothetical protein GIB67_029903 [Kingdonia uniflora]